MAEDEVTPVVRRFIAQYIDSVAQLEALLLLRNNPEEEWSADVVAKRLYVSEGTAGGVLGMLANHGLIGVADPNGPLFRYGPRAAEMAHVVDELADTYAKKLVAVSTLIHTKPRSNVQSFADAFRFKKEG